MKRPDIGECPDGQLLMTWNTGDHHFEIEVFPDGRVELMYCDFSTDNGDETVVRLNHSDGIRKALKGE